MVFLVVERPHHGPLEASRAQAASPLAWQTVASEIRPGGHKRCCGSHFPAALLAVVNVVALAGPIRVAALVRLQRAGRRGPDRQQGSPGFRGLGVGDHPLGAHQPGDFGAAGVGKGTGVRGAAGADAQEFQREAVVEASGEGPTPTVTLTSLPVWSAASVATSPPKELKGRIHPSCLNRAGVSDECLFLSEKRSIFEDATSCVIWSFYQKNMGKTCVSGDRNGTGTQSPRLH